MISEKVKAEPRKKSGPARRGPADPLAFVRYHRPDLALGGWGARKPSEPRTDLTWHDLTMNIRCGVRLTICGPKWGIPEKNDGNRTIEPTPCSNKVSSGSLFVDGAGACILADRRSPLRVVFGLLGPRRMRRRLSRPFGSDRPRSLRSLMVRRRGRRNNRALEDGRSTRSRSG